MKKWIAILLMMVLAVLAGCQSETDLEAYQAAVEKKKSAAQGKSESRIVIDNQFKFEGMTKEERKAMAAFERMELDTYVRYDETRMQNDFYMNFGGIGFDAAFYQVDDLQFMRLPLVNKYMKLDASQTEPSFDPGWLAFFDPVEEEWMRMLTEENIFQGKRHVLSTEDGDVKVTRFSIELDESQVRRLVERLAVILEENQDQLLSSGFFGEMDPAAGRKMIQGFAEQVRLAHFDDFVFTADIDIDGYLIQDEFHGAISYGVGNEMTTVDVKNLYWGFHEEPVFTIPTPTDEEWIDETDPEADASFLKDFMGGIMK